MIYDWLIAIGVDHLRVFFLLSILFSTVVLLDTTKEATLEWTRYPYGPQAQTPGVSIR